MKTNQIPLPTVSFYGLAVLVVGLLAQTTINVSAEHYTLQDQTLVSGTQKLDPRYSDGQHFVREQCVGVSTILGLYRESSILTRSVVTGPNGAKTVVLTGQVVYTCANGDQIFSSLRGTCVISGSAGTRTSCADVIQCKVTVTGGTGSYKNVSGSGQRTCLVKADGQFSSLTFVTLSFPGEREK